MSLTVRLKHILLLSSTINRLFPSFQFGTVTDSVTIDILIHIPYELLLA